MNQEAVLNFLGSAALAAIVVAVINALTTRKKLGAEATKVITDAAAGVVADLREEGDRKDRRIAALESRVSELETEREDQRRTLQTHAAWDYMAIDRLRTCDPPLSIVDPPPLTVAPRRRRTKPKETT